MLKYYHCLFCLAFAKMIKKICPQLSKDAWHSFKDKLWFAKQHRIIFNPTSEKAFFKIIISMKFQEDCSSEQTPAYSNFSSRKKLLQKVKILFQSASMLITHETEVTIIL